MAPRLRCRSRGDSRRPVDWSVPRSCRLRARLMWGLAALQTVRLGWNLYQRAALAPIPARPQPDARRTYLPLSIIIPARNEAQNIGPCLDGARAQDYPGLEIMVVDDRSEDGTGEIVRQAAGADPR